MGRTTRVRARKSGRTGISIHALRGEDDAKALALCRALLHFNPRPPWGGRQAPYRERLNSLAISIHALRGEDDEQVTEIKVDWEDISIHALRGEDDA